MKKNQPDKKLGFKELLRSGRPLRGTFIYIASPDLVEIIGQVGYDFIIIDTEHGPFGMETAVNLVRAADATGLFSVVRVPQNEPVSICKALDLGADGVLVPQVRSKQEALAAVSAAKYVPGGYRGAHPAVRAADYSLHDGPEFFRRSNETTVVWLLMESVEGLQNLEEILVVSGYDAIFIGPMDLSHSLGVPGQLDHELVTSKVGEAITKAQQQGVPCGLFCVSAEDARHYLRRGVNFVAISVDSAIIANAYRDVLKAVGS